MANWYGRRFDVELDPENEVMAMIGSKEGIGHIAFAFVDPGDEALIPDPGYPVYGVSTRLAGGTPVSLRCPRTRGSCPDLDAAPVSERTKAIWLNFPSNPTAAVAEFSTFEAAAAFAREHDLILLHDAAYSEITFDGYVAPSASGRRRQGLHARVRLGVEVLQHDRLADRMGGGSAEAIRALGVVKTNLDIGQFTAIQRAAIAALEGPPEHLDELRATYQRRRDLVIETLNGLGWSLKPPLGSCYVWAPVPEGETSTSFADDSSTRPACSWRPAAATASEAKGSCASRSPSRTTGSPRRWIGSDGARVTAR